MAIVLTVFIKKDLQVLLVQVSPGILLYFLKPEFGKAFLAHVLYFVN